MTIPEESDSEKGSKPVVLSAFNTIGLVGEITEETSNEVIFAMTTLKETIKTVVGDIADDEADKEQECEIEMFISTPGGNADDMFAIYDVMRLVKDECDIKVTGVGKVMSAGVLLLAAGTKGKRRIGKNCRVMIHSVIGGVHGGFYNVENEMDEIRWVQTQYIKMLASETDMSQAQLKKMLQRKVNVYLSAEEAVEMGIADIVV